MAFKHFIALAAGTVGGAAGSFHFDPKRDDENGRYQKGIIPADIGAKAEQRGLVKLGDDATETDYQMQILGMSAAPAKVAAKRLMELPADEIGFAAGTAAGTIVSRNFPAGQGLDGGLDPDAAPAPGGAGAASDADAGTGTILDQSIPKLREALKDVDTVEELDRLHELEAGKAKPRDGALEAIDDRKQEIAPAA